MNYREINILVKYISSRLGFGKFHEMMRLVDGSFNDSYIEEKWTIFCQDRCVFVFTWEAFFDEVMRDIETTGYKG